MTLWSSWLVRTHSCTTSDDHEWAWNSFTNQVLTHQGRYFACLHSSLLQDNEKKSLLRKSHVVLPSCTWYCKKDPAMGQGFVYHSVMGHNVPSNSNDVRVSLVFQTVVGQIWLGNWLYNDRKDQWRIHGEGACSIPVLKRSREKWPS